MLCDYRQKLGGVVNRQKIYILHSHLFAKQSHTRTYQHSISFILFSELFAPMRKGKIFSANHIFSGNAKTLYIHIQKFPEKYPGIHLEVPLNASKPSISYLKIHTRQIQVYHNWIFKSVCQIKIKWVEYFLISFFSRIHRRSVHYCIKEKIFRIHTTHARIEKIRSPLPFRQEII